MPDEYFYILLRSLTSTHYPAHYMTSLLGNDADGSHHYAPYRLKLLEDSGYIQHFKKEAVFGDNNEILEKTRTTLFFLPNSYALDLEQIHRNTFLRKYPFSKKTITNRLNRLTKRILESPTITDYNGSYIKFDLKDVRYKHFDLVNDYYYENIYNKVSNIKTLDYLKMNLRESGFVANDSNIEVNHVYAQNLVFKYFQGITENKINKGLTNQESLSAASQVLDKMFFTDNSLNFKAIILWKLIYRLHQVDKTKYPIISEFCDSYNKAKTIFDDVIEQSVINIGTERFKINLTIQHISILVDAAMNVTRFYPTRYQDNEFTNYGLILDDITKEVPTSSAAIDLFNIIKNHKFFLELRTLYKECSSLIDLTKPHKTLNNKLLLPNTSNTPHIEKKKILRAQENAHVYKANNEIKEEFDVDDSTIHITDSSSFDIAKNKFIDIQKGN